MTMSSLEIAMAQLRESVREVVRSKVDDADVSEDITRAIMRKVEPGYRNMWGVCDRLRANEQYFLKAMIAWRDAAHDTEMTSILLSSKDDPGDFPPDKG